MTFMVLNGLSQYRCDSQKVAKGVCDVDDKASVGDNATTQVVVTVGVE